MIISNDYRTFLSSQKLFRRAGKMSKSVIVNDKFKQLSVAAAGV